MLLNASQPFLPGGWGEGRVGSVEDSGGKEGGVWVCVWGGRQEGRWKKAAGMVVVGVIRLVGKVWCGGPSHCLCVCVCAACLAVKCVCLCARACRGLYRRTLS